MLTLLKKHMRSITLFTFILGFLFSVNAQTAIKANFEKWTAYNSKPTFHEGIIHLENPSDKPALLWLNNTRFKNGTIEVDIKGNDVRGESFLGIAFHAVDNENYDAVYFRPFNFRSPERKSHSIQYVNLPENDWDMLREKYPGKYENVVQPVPDPNDWFRAKIVIDFPLVKVYVNGSSEPSLVVEQLSKTLSGRLGLWVDSKDGWFKNVVITHAK